MYNNILISFLYGIFLNLSTFVRKGITTFLISMYPLLWITFLHNQLLQVTTKITKKNPWQHIEPHGIVLYYVSIITQLLDEKICFVHSSVPVYTTDCIPYTKCTKLSTHILPECSACYILDISTYYIYVMPMIAVVFNWKLIG